MDKIQIDKFDLEVIKALRELGIPAHIKGYEFIKTAIKYIRKNPSSMYFLTKEVYPRVGEMHGDNISDHKVERGIRHAISEIRANDETRHRLLGRAGHMAVGEFLASLSESIRIKLASQPKCSIDLTKIEPLLGTWTKEDILKNEG